MIEKVVAGKNIKKPLCLEEYNKHMGGVDLKDQKLQPFLLERKKGSKWYIKLFKRLLNVSIHNAYIVYKTKYPKMQHFQYRLDLVKQLVFTYQGEAIHLKSPARGRPSINPPPKRLLEKHFITKLSPTGKKAKPQRCVVCVKKNIRKESTYWCPDCEVGLCFEPCFKIFHTEFNF